MRNRSKRILKKESTADEKRTFFKKKSNTIENKPAGFFSYHGINPKLKMSQPGDKSEQQADAVADKVVKNKADSKSIQTQLESGIGRSQEEEAAAKFELHRQEEEEAASKMEVQKAEEEETEAKFEIQRAEEDEAAGKSELHRQEDEEAAGKHEVQKAEDEEASAKAMIHRKEEKGTHPNFEKRLKKAKSGGYPLPEKVREEMEGKMKKDFTQVRIHTDGEAIALCRDIKAQAFTNGYHIFFNKGKFQPESSAGKHLLAHELTHVVQQKR